MAKEYPAQRAAVRRIAKARAKPWPKNANQARVDSINNGMDGLIKAQKAQHQLREVKSMAKNRDYTRTLLAASELRTLLVEMELAFERIVNALDNIPPEYPEPETDDE